MGTVTTLSLVLVLAIVAIYFFWVRKPSSK
jgi:uncharacterized membrane protein YobD (UPF0266 family)